MNDLKWFRLPWNFPNQSHRYLPIWLSLFLGIGLSVSAAVRVSQWKLDTTEATLARRADNLAVSLQSNLEEYVQVTRALGAFYDSDDEIAREDFQAFSKPFLERYPGILGMAWVKPVADRDRAEFEAAIAAEGFPNFTLKERTPDNQFIPAAKRPEYFVVTYGEPIDTYRSVIGADWGGDRFDPKFLKTLKHARDTGEMVPTEKLLLVSNTGGFALFKPIYQRGMPTDTVANRQKYFLGIVYSIYQLSALVEESILSLNLENINFYLIDDFVTSKNKILGFYSSKTRQFHDQHPDEKIAKAEINSCQNQDKCRRKITIGNREWSLIIVPTPGFYGSNWETLSTLAIGFLLTSFLVIYLFLSIRHTEDLRTAMKQLQLTQAKLVQAEKMSSLGQLVAGVAHEINNPVSFIYGNVTHAQEYFEDLLNILQLYQAEYPNPTPEIIAETEEIDLNFIQEDLPKTLNSMRFGAERIQKIVLSLRTFSRMDEAEMKFVDIHESLESTLLILQTRLKATSQRSEIEVMREYGDLPQVECYAGQLNQVFMNILANAIDALDSISSLSSASNSVSTQPKENRPYRIQILTELIKEQDSVVIRIRDNGIGMNEEIQKNLFNPFFTTKTVGKGTGLGLSISYQIVVDQHGGILKYCSEPRAGSEFWIEIPIRQTKGMKIGNRQ